MRRYYFVFGGAAPWSCGRADIVAVSAAHCPSCRREIAMSWEQLNQTYFENGVVLAFGAGVSVGSGLPTWTELLGRVSLECGLTPTLVADLQAAGFGLPAIAGMLQEYAQEGTFPELVRKCLYKTFPRDLHDASWSDWGRLVEHVQSKNPTLRSVAALCAVASSERTFVRNPRVHAIIDFNIDAVFRAFIHARYGDPLLVRSIERPSKSSELAKISVYYMHGFLRFDSRAGRADKEAGDKLVLSERDIRLLNSPTSLFNYTFLSMLREHSCLFIGLSIRDDNIRRLLHYSSSERLASYHEEGKVPDRARARTLRHFAILPRYKSAAADVTPERERAVDLAVERSLANLGTTVLWASPDEIPKHLERMYAAGGDRWEAVF